MFSASCEVVGVLLKDVTDQTINTAELLLQVDEERFLSTSPVGLECGGTQFQSVVSRMARYVLT